MLTTVTVVAFAALAAFVFARFAFRGREVCLHVLHARAVVPGAVAILPLFILLRTVGPARQPARGRAAQAAFALPLTIIILRPFFRSIPVELEDAAAIDGCGRFGFFWRVLLPLSRPALATVAVLASWRAGTPSCCRCSSSFERQWTLPLGVMNFSTQYSPEWQSSPTPRCHGPGAPLLCFR